MGRNREREKQYSASKSGSVASDKKSLSASPKAKRSPHGHHHKHGHTQPSPTARKSNEQRTPTAIANARQQSVPPPSQRSSNKRAAEGISNSSSGTPSKKRKADQAPVPQPSTPSQPKASSTPVVRRTPASAPAATSAASLSLGRARENAITIPSDDSSSSDSDDDDSSSDSDSDDDAAVARPIFGVKSPAGKGIPPAGKTTVTPSRRGAPGVGITPIKEEPSPAIKREAFSAGKSMVIDSSSESEFGSDSDSDVQVVQSKTVELPPLNGKMPCFNCVRAELAGKNHMARCEGPRCQPCRLGNQVCEALPNDLKPSVMLLQQTKASSAADKERSAMRIRWFIEYQVKNIRPEQVAATAGGGIDKIENREQFQAVWRALGEYLGK